MMIGRSSKFHFKFILSYVLIGPSGCGKTTLLHCILRLHELNGGCVNFSPEISSKRMIGYMPQQMCLSKDLTTRELLTFFGRIYGMKNETIKQRIKFLMDLVVVGDGDKLISKFSGGEQRRISMAVTLMHEPKMIFLDEPTVGLDPLLREKLWNFLAVETKKKKLTVVITSHYIEHAKSANCVSFMRQGRLLCESSHAEVLKKTGCEYLEEAFLKLSLTEVDDKNTEKSDAKHSSQFKEFADTVLELKRLQAMTVKNTIQSFRSFK